MDAESSVQSKKAAKLENIDCGLDRSLLLIAGFDRVFERIGHAGLIAFRHHFGSLRSNFGDLERGWKTN